MTTEFRLKNPEWGFAQYTRKKGKAHFVPTDDQIDRARRRVVGLICRRYHGRYFFDGDVKPSTIAKSIVHGVYSRGGDIGRGIHERQVTVREAVKVMLESGDLVITVDEDNVLTVSVCEALRPPRSRSGRRQFTNKRGGRRSRRDWAA